MKMVKQNDTLPLFGDLKVGTIFSCMLEAHHSSIFVKQNKRKAILIRDYECPISARRIPSETAITNIYELYQIGEIK